MELQDIKQKCGDSEDFKIPQKVKLEIRRCWSITTFIIAWLAALLFVYDNIMSFYIYKFWTISLKQPNFHASMLAWLIFSIISAIYTVIMLYNMILESIKFIRNKEHKKLFCKSIPHQYMVFFAFYIVEIPKGIIYLIFLTNYSFIPDEGRLEHQVGFLGTGKYDHLYYKLSIDIVKMLFLVIICLLDFCDIANKDKNHYFLVLNMIGATINLCLQITGIILKISYEQK